MYSNVQNEDCIVFWDELGGGDDILMQEADMILVDLCTYPLTCSLLGRAICLTEIASWAFSALHLSYTW